jgi:hypothetical protein
MGVFFGSVQQCAAVTSEENTRASVMSLPTALTALGPWCGRKERKGRMQNTAADSLATFFTPFSFTHGVARFILPQLRASYSSSARDIIARKKQWMVRVISAAAVWPLMRQPWTA